MKVSIIIPVYNRAEKVMRTLESVKGQTYRPLQVVLVDNGSTDGTLVALNQYRLDESEPDYEVKVEQEPVKGACAARNRGFAASDGEWVMFFDSDDVMEKGLVKSYVKEVENLRGHVDIVMAKGVLKSENGETRKLPFYKSDLIARHILHCVLATQRYAIRREFFARTDMWNTGLPAWNDWEMGLRLLLARPRLAHLSGKPRVTVISSGDQSITGTEFSSRHGYWERVITLMMDEIRCSDLKDKLRYLRLLEYRKMVLASQYYKEGNNDLAQALYTDTMQRVRRSLCMRLVMPWLYRRLCSGKRGTAQIARLMVK
ncbi:MAG: glycosyltransferase family 2 protein [Muribaculaceae bacterium]|nr:glycosyltransferase family 2 protein [Muribaculaceae bacterium]